MSRDTDWLQAVADELTRLRRAGCKRGDIDVSIPRELSGIFRTNVGRTNLRTFCGAAPETLLIVGVSFDPSDCRGRFEWRDLEWNRLASAGGVRIVDAKGIAVYPPIDFACLSAIQG
jgi:hypothetical protein